MKAAALVLLLAGAAAAKPFAGLLLGDWGGQDSAPYTTQDQVDCAKGMEKVAESTGAETVFLLGDNFYSSGIHQDEHDPRFQETFEKVYTGSALSSAEYWVVLGNHDAKTATSPAAEVKYSNVSSRWNFPALWYTKTFTVDTRADGTPVTMDIVAFDSVSLLGNSDEAEYKFGPLPGPPDAALAATQWEFIDNALKASKADYLFTMAHYPVWSGCSHGPTAGLVAGLKPKLESYGASGHICGHDHCLEHIDEGKGPVYILSGAGKECCYANSNADKLPAGSLKFALWDDGKGPTLEGGFASFLVDKGAFNVTYHAPNGTVLYRADPILPRKL